MPPGIPEVLGEALEVGPSVGQGSGSPAQACFSVSQEDYLSASPKWLYMFCVSLDSRNKRFRAHLAPTVLGLSSKSAFISLWVWANSSSVKWENNNTYLLLDCCIRSCLSMSLAVTVSYVLFFRHSQRWSAMRGPLGKTQCRVDLNRLVNSEGFNTPH